jgi:hypothetical protein
MPASRLPSSQALRNLGYQPVKVNISRKGKIQVISNRLPLGCKRINRDGTVKEFLYPKRSMRLYHKRLAAEEKLKVHVLLDALASLPYDLTEKDIENAFEENGIPYSPTNPALDALDELPPLELPPAMKKSLGEFFGKVVRKATRPVSTIEEDSDTSDSDGVIDPFSFCQPPTCDDE